MRARINPHSYRLRTAKARELFKQSAGKSMLDCPGALIDLRMLARQLADDVDGLLDVIEGERGEKSSTIRLDP